MDTGLLEKPVTMEDVVHEVSKMKGVLAEAVQDGMHSAMRNIKKGRHAAEDALEETRHTVKRYPFEAVGIAFGTGLVIGGLACWAFRRR